MKEKLKILLLIPLQFILYESYSQECHPNPDGYYMYYANLNINVENDFSKADFMNLLENSTEFSENMLLYINSIIINVEKSFPSAVTPFLQHSISIDSNFNQLDS
jgi:hypothetical protein